MQQPAIQIHPMVPLAKASALLKISREELITRLKSGELKGEKRRIGESKKDSWFIYADEFDKLLAQALEKYEERISTRGLEHIFKPVPSQPVSPTVTNADHGLDHRLDHRLDHDLEKSAIVNETVTIQPVAFNHQESDPGEIIDALGTNYALGSDYEQTDFAVQRVNEQASENQVMVAQLVQHLQEEKQVAEALKSRLSALEEEVELLRRDLLARPDQQAHSIFGRMKVYFRLVLGKST